MTLATSYTFNEKNYSVYITFTVVVKVQLFREGHKNVRNRPSGFEIQLNSKRKKHFCSLLREAELYTARLLT